MKSYHRIDSNVNRTHCTRRSVDASLYLERSRANVLKSDDDWVVWIAERIFEVVVDARNVKCWTVVN